MLLEPGGVARVRTRTRPGRGATFASVKRAAEISRRAEQTPSPRQSIRSLLDRRTSVIQRHRQILAGFPVDSVSAIAGRLGLAPEELAARCGLSRGSFRRKIRARRALSPIESDMLARYWDLFEQAVNVFGRDRSSAQVWLSHSQPGLGGEIPLECARTSVGAREVEKLLRRIDLGVYT